MNYLTSCLRHISHRLSSALTLLVMGGLSFSLHAEEKSTEFQVIYRLNSSHIEPALYDNAAQVNNAIKFLNEIKNNPDIKIVSVAFCGTASPEGPYEINKDLATKRLKEMERLVRDQVEISDDIVTYDTGYIPWDMLKREVAASNLENKEEILSILSENPEIVPFGTRRTIDSRVPKLMKLNNGKTWNELNKLYFNEMRLASAMIVTYEDVSEPVTEAVQEEPVVQEVQPEPEPVVEETVVEVVMEEIQTEEIPSDWYRKMYIKTNVPAWALLWQNLAVEVDLAKHWSFALPVYWSPYNYGKQTLKFRTLAFVPEFRYWPKAENMGFFVNAHFGLAYYNYAKNGEFRYQDHRGKTPAIGGGLGLGYRFYFCKNHHWSMEAAIGAGVYRLDYDIFMNTPHTDNGYLLDRRKRTFFGIDQAAFTISYSFGLRKKGGNQ